MEFTNKSPLHLHQSHRAPRQVSLLPALQAAAMSISCVRVLVSRTVHIRHPALPPLAGLKHMGLARCWCRSSRALAWRIRGLCSTPSTASWCRGGTGKGKGNERSALPNPKGRRCGERGGRAGDARPLSSLQMPDSDSSGMACLERRRMPKREPPNLHEMKIDRCSVVTPFARFR